MRDLQTGRRWLTPEDCAAVDAVANDGMPEANDRAYQLLIAIAKEKRLASKPRWGLEE